MTTNADDEWRDRQQDNLTIRQMVSHVKMHAASGSSPSEWLADAVSELHSRWHESDWETPTHVPDQRDLIAELFDTDEPAWLIFLDAGRYDIFDQIVDEYFEGELRRVHNGGVGYTGDWAARNLTGQYPGRGLFSWVPLRSFASAEYDGRDHFDAAPDIQAEYAHGATESVAERLEYLGYGDDMGGGGTQADPEEDTVAAVNRSVADRLDDLNGGVVRYIKPHPPFPALPDVTGGSEKKLQTRTALEDGDLTYGDLTDAYVETYHIGLEAAIKLAPMLPGRVVVTADHGTCLTCGQLFHGRYAEMHEHLTVVPWFEVSNVV